MAYYSANYYTVTGGESDYTLSFEGESPGYIEEDHVIYYVGSVAQPNSSRTFLTATSVRIDPVPADGTEISFRRITSPTEALVDWLAGESITEVNLDKLSTQLLYLSQEAADAAYIDTAAVQSAETNAIASAAAALASETAADAAQTAAESAQSAAESAQTAAETAQTGAETAETNAAASAASIAGVNSNITSMIGLDDDGIPVAKVDGALANIADDTSPEFSNDVNGQGNELYDILFKDTGDTVQALGTLSSNTAIDLESGNVITFTLGAALTLSFTNWIASPDLGFALLKITNGGAYTLTLPAALDWGDADAPTLQTSGEDWILLWTTSAGSTIYAKLAWTEV